MGEFAFGVEEVREGDPAEANPGVAEELPSAEEVEAGA
jgi:hypothetical protein